jgi:uroporphyrinogen-III synthase
LRKETLPQALKEGGIKFNEISVPNRTSAFKISDQENFAIMFFSPSAVESYLSNNKIKKKFVLHWQYNGFGIRSKEKLKIL